MKRVIIALLCLVMVACNSNKESFTLNGTLNDYQGKLYLSLLEGKMPVVIDSVNAAEGVFTFKGSVETPILATISDSNRTELVRFFIENSNINILFNEQKPEVVGSTTQDDYKAVRGLVDTLLKQAYNPETPKEQAESLYNASIQTRFDFIAEHPNSVASAYVLYRELSYEMTHEEISAAVDSLSEQVRKSIYAQQLISMAETLKATSAGMPYKEIALPTPAGDTVRLSQMFDGNTYVLLDFWASWCPPCRAELPNLVKLYKKYHFKGEDKTKKNFEIYAVSLDRDAEAWNKGIEKFGLNWVNVSDLKFWNCAPAAEYGVRAIPSNLLIAPDGTILARNLMGEELQAKLEELMGR